MLNIVDLNVTFDGTTILHDVDLAVERGEIVCLLGPSGCGKTTLLRAIAGLEKTLYGSIKLEGQSIESVPVHERGFGLMFQEFALFPHMNVRENVRFGLRMRGDHNHNERVQEVLDLVGLNGFGARDVTSLSGGERQRVALARSLAPNPRLLMLDEPLGSLDAALRQRLIVDLRAIIKQVGLTAIYVTHDQQEAFAIADRIAVMDAGRILQVASPEHLFRHPHTERVARFLQLDNIVPIKTRRDREAITDIGAFDVDDNAESVLIHPDEIQIAPDADISAVVVERVFAGRIYRLRVRTETGILLQCLVPSHTQDIPHVGDNVRLCIDKEAASSLVEPKPPIR